MAVTMTLEATSSTITATASGLDPSYAYDRRFVWYLDGVKRTEEAVAPGSASHEYTFTGVYFYSQHHVRLEIYSTVSGALLTTQEGTISTLYANIPLWSWSASNGDASAAQTAAAYAAATGKGLVTDFSHLVWDDLVTLLHTALTDAGARWLGSSYSSLLLDAGDPLTAQMFNAMVQNIRYPYWEWESKPGSAGYLGRQDMRSGDWVYGKYIIELAKRLNTVIGIYNGTANTRETGYTESINLLLDDAYAVSRHSAPAAYTEHIWLDDTARAVSRHSEPAEIKQSMLLSHVMGLIAKGKADMEHYGDLALLNRVRIAVNGNLSPITVDTGLSELTARMVVDSSPTLHLPGGSVESAVTTAALLRGLIARKLVSDTSVIADTAATLNRLESLRIGADTTVDARISAELSRRMACILASAVDISSTTRADMIRAIAQNAMSHVTVAGTVNGIIRAVRASNATGELEVRHSVTANADRSRATSTSAAVSHCVDINSTARKAFPRPTAGQSTLVIDISGAAQACRPVSLSGDAAVSNAAAGSVVKSRPLLLTGHAMSGATGSGAAVLRPSKHLRGHSGNVLSFDAALQNRKAIPLFSTVCVSAATTAKLEIDGGEGKWKNPVQVGDELTIYQVHLVGQRKDVVRIDWVRYAEFAASNSLMLSDSAKMFMSRGWEYSKQYKRILTVYQSVSVTAGNNEIEVS